MKVEPPPFADVAEVLSTSVAIVEKDYYTVALLSLLQFPQDEPYKLVFSGGTCLAKVYAKNDRMSEDIDLKLVPAASAIAKSNSSQKEFRKEFGKKLLKTLTQGGQFHLASEKKKNEYRYQEYLLKYPKKSDPQDYLRPEIKLEITESSLYQPCLEHSISSFYSEVSKNNPEIESLQCVGFETILAEKILSLLRRTAGVERGVTEWEDEMLVRHAYDLHIASSKKRDQNTFKDIFVKATETDRKQFRKKHPQFQENPQKELRFGYEVLKTKPLYRDRYDKFVGPLVFNPSPPSWDSALKTVDDLLQELWL